MNTPLPELRFPRYYRSTSYSSGGIVVHLSKILSSMVLAEDHSNMRHSDYMAKHNDGLGQ